MPEGPEVRTVVDSLEHKVRGRVVENTYKSELNLRRPLSNEALQSFANARIASMHTHGKFFWMTFDNMREVLGFRLGMSGRLLLEPSAQEPQKHTHVVLSLGDEELRYVDPRRFGEVFVLDEGALEKERARLGLDGLKIEPDKVGAVFERVRRTTRSLKDVLLDQSLFAGVGNIYACEALFHAQLSPKLRGCDLSLEQCELLLSSIEAVLVSSLSHRGTTFRDFADGDGHSGNALSFLAVFNRGDESCERCGFVIERFKQGGRSTFWCAGCQR